MQGLFIAFNKQQVLTLPATSMLHSVVKQQKEATDNLSEASLKFYLPFPIWRPWESSNPTGISSARVLRWLPQRCSVLSSLNKRKNLNEI